MIIAFTGAGISKASGIPTFEDQGDLRTKLSRSFSKRHPEEYNKIIQGLEDSCKRAKPNDAHLALAEYDIPVITMNIDRLHQRAGTNHVLAVHGDLPNIVLYEDPAPLYSEALGMIDRMIETDILLVVGTSGYTRISTELVTMAEIHRVSVVKINSDAESNVRAFLENNKSHIGDYDEFMAREIQI